MAGMICGDWYSTLSANALQRTPSEGICTTMPEGLAVLICYVIPKPKRLFNGCYTVNGIMCSLFLVHTTTSLPGGWIWSRLSTMNEMR